MNKEKGFSQILIVILVLLLAVGLFTFVKYRKPSEVDNTPTNQTQTTKSFHVRSKTDLDVAKTGADSVDLNVIDNTILQNEKDASAF